MSNAYVGEIRLWASLRTPRDWMPCEGQMLQASNYPQLFSVIGHSYGGDNQSIFNLPDLRGRVPIGQGQGPGLTNRPLAVPGGAEMAELTPGEIGLHRHAPMAALAPADAIVPDSSRVLATAASNVLAYVDMNKPTGANAVFSSRVLGTGDGLGQPHSNMMPTAVMRYIICVFGLFPTA